MSNELINAAKNGNLLAVNALRKDPSTDLNATTDGGNTALMFAAYEGHTGIVRALLATPGINVDVAALAYAAERGHTEIVAVLLADRYCREYVNVVNTPYGRPPLWLAAKNGHTRIVRALLDVPGIDVNPQKLWWSDTALTIAAQNGHTEIVRALLAAPGIKVKPTIDDGYTVELVIRKGWTEIATLLAPPVYASFVEAPNDTARQSIIDAANMKNSTPYTQYLCAALPDDKNTSAWYGRGKQRYRFMKSSPSAFLNFIIEDTITPAARRLELLEMLQRVSQERGATKLTKEEQQTLETQITTLQNTLTTQHKKEKESIPQLNTRAEAGPSEAPAPTYTPAESSAPPPSYAAAQSAAPITTHAILARRLGANDPAHSNQFDYLGIEEDAPTVVASPPSYAECSASAALANEGVELQTLTHTEAATLPNYDAIVWPVAPSNRAKASPAPAPELDSDADEERQLTLAS